MRSRGYLGKCGPRQSKGQELGAQSCECEDVVGHPQDEGIAVRLPSARPGGRGGAVRPAGLSGPLPTVLVSLPARYFFNKEGDFNHLTAAAYHKKVHLLVTGFASGIFHLHELPEFNLIHSLRSVILLCVVMCVRACVRVCLCVCARTLSVHQRAVGEGGSRAVPVWTKGRGVAASRTGGFPGHLCLPLSWIREIGGAAALPPSQTCSPLGPIHPPVRGSFGSTCRSHCVYFLFSFFFSCIFGTLRKLKALVSQSHAASSF